MNPSVEGFSELVGRFQPENPPELPDSVEAIWAGLIYPAFLGAQTRSAQAAFLSDLLGDHLDYPGRSSARVDPHWSGTALDTIQAVRATIPPGSPGAQMKRVALHQAEKLLKTGDLANMVVSADDFFSTRGVNPALLRTMLPSITKQEAFIVDAASGIHLFGITKATLWLYDCDLGAEVAPPNPQIRRFLKEWGFKDSSLDPDADDYHAFPIACTRIREVAVDVSARLGRTASARRCQHAAWLWQTCVGLLAFHRKGSRLSVGKLLDFLDSEGWTPETLDDQVGRVDTVEDLGNRLAAFV